MIFLRTKAVLVGALAGGGLALACQFVPPYHVLNHEFTQAFSLITGIALYFLSTRIGKKVTAQESDLADVFKMQSALMVSIFSALAVSGTGFAVMAAANSWLHNCHFEKGILFFWITWTPLALFFCALGVIGAFRQWRWWQRTILVLVLVLASILQDASQCFQGVCIVDFLIGSPLCFDQRASMTIPRIHVYQRIMLLLITVTVWHLALWRLGLRCEKGDQNYAANLRNIRNKGLALATVVVLTVTCCGSYVGIGWGKGALIGALSEEHSSDHFVFHYAPDGQATRGIDDTVREAEWCWYRISKQLNVNPKRKVHIYISETAAMQEELTGISAPHAGPWWISSPAYGIEGAMYHELVHALDSRMARHDLDMLGKVFDLMGLLRDFLILKPVFLRGRYEGPSRAFEKDYALIPETHRGMAYTLRDGRLPSAVEFMGFDGFRRVGEGRAYDLAGSFIGFLSIEYGTDKLKEFLDSNSDYVHVYGKDLETLNAEWWAFIEGIEIPPRIQTTWLESFSVPLSPDYRGFNTVCCPKLGARDKTLEQIARDSWYNADYEASLSFYEELYASTGQSRFRLAQVRALHRLERTGEALKILTEILKDDSLTGVQRLSYIKEKASYLMMQKEWDRLYQAMDLWMSLEDNPHEDTLIVHAALRNPAYRDEVAEVLLGVNVQEVLENLITDYPEDEDIRYLHQTRVESSTQTTPSLSLATPNEMAQVFELLAEIRSGSETSVETLSNLLFLAQTSVKTGDLDTAEQIAVALIEPCEDPVELLRARTILERVSFERARMVS